VKCFKHKLKVKGNPSHIELVSFCCPHFGHKACDRKRLMSWRNWVMRGPNRFAFALGDDMENAIPGDEVHNSMMWDSDKHPEEQYMEAADFWRPMAEAGKLLITHDSNHAWRTEAKTGRSVARELNVFLQAQSLDKARTEPTPDVTPFWGRWQALTELRVGRQAYTIHSWHGSGSGSSPEAALRKCREQERFHQADLFLMGHAHQPIAWGKDVNVFSDHGMVAGKRQRWFGVTGGFIGWDDTYAERAGYGPNRRGAIVIRLGVKDWDIKIQT
jgi:hypothetical protein